MRERVELREERATDPVVPCPRAAKHELGEERMACPPLTYIGHVCKSKNTYLPTYLSTYLPTYLPTYTTRRIAKIGIVGFSGYLNGPRDLKRSYAVTVRRRRRTSWPARQPAARLHAYMHTYIRWL